MPLRQVYYWGVEEASPGPTPPTTTPCYWPLTTISTMWSSGTALTRPNRLSPVAAARPPRPIDTAASGVLVDEAQRELRELHADARIPEPTSAYFTNWVQDPYGAAYHFWQVGAKSWEGHAAYAQAVP